MKNDETPQVLQLKITIRDIRPPVWRRILVSDGKTLRELHTAIQGAFGWEDYHLHEFEIGGVSYADPLADDSGELEFQDDGRTRLRDLGLKKGRSFLYRYDFGDDWEHRIVVEEVVPRKRGTRLPQCIGGARARPPEDVGGTGGYESFLEAIADPEDEEHDHLLQWAGGSFDPEAFDLEATDRALQSRTRPRWSGAESIFPDERGEEGARRLLMRTPAVPLESGQAATCEALPLRRDVVATLEYLRDNRVTGTQSRGNFALKAVEEIAGRFVDPPELEQRYGQLAFRFKSEEEVWAIYFVHVLANGARLITGGPGRRWKLTPAGAQFLQVSAIDQTWALFAAWWYEIDWLVAVPRSQEGEHLSERFTALVLAALRSVAAGGETPFRSFAEGVLEAWGWKRTPEVSEAQWDFLLAVVRQAVIEPLERFGMLEAKRTAEKTPWGERERLSAFEVTALGHAFFAALE